MRKVRADRQFLMRMTAAEHHRLAQLAKHNGRSMAGMVRWLIAGFLKDQAAAQRILQEETR